MKTAEYDINLRTAARVVRRRWRLIAGLTVLVTVATAALAVVRRPPDEYRATATVKIEKSSTVTGIYLEAISWSDADYLETQAAIITSFPVLAEVARELGLVDRDLPENQLATDHRAIATVLDLQARLTAQRVGNSNLIDIEAAAPDSLAAQELANTVARVFARRHTAAINRRTTDARAFIEEQLAGVAARLAAAEEALRRYREEHGLVSLDEQTGGLLDRQARAEGELQGLQRQEATLRAAAAVLHQAADDPETLAGLVVPADGDPMVGETAGHLAALLAQRQSMLEVFTAAHPKVAAVEAEIGQAAARLTRAVTARLAAVERQRRAAAQRLAAVSRQLAELPGQGLVVSRLQRQVALNQNLYDLLESKLQEARIKEAARIEEVTVVRPALEPMAPVRQVAVPARAAAGLGVGLVLGLLAALLLETLDPSMDSVELVGAFTGLEVMAAVPQLPAPEIAACARRFAGGGEPDRSLVLRVARLVTHYLPTATIAERYRQAMAAVRFASRDKQLKVVGFTSAVANEGKSSALLNTAIALAQAHQRVLVVEADLRRPIMARWLGMDSSPGLTEVLLNTCSRRQATRTVTDLILGQMEVEEVTATPGLDNLFVLPCGAVPDNPSELLFSPSFQQLLSEAASDYDMVLVDLPPVLVGADTAVMGSRLDAMVMVYRAARTDRRHLRHALDQLRRASVPLLGILLTGVETAGADAVLRHEYVPTPVPGGAPLSLAARLARLGRRPVAAALLAASTLTLAAGLFWSWWGA